MNIENMIESSKNALRSALKKRSKSDRWEHETVSLYTAAFAQHFQNWLALTYPFVQHELAQFALKDNLRCELEQRHACLLEDFAASCRAHPSEKHKRHLQPELFDIYSEFEHTKSAGLHGLSVLTTLECLSEDFIPVLARIGRKKQANMNYCKVHGVADKAHSDAFKKALQAELDLRSAFGVHRGESGIVSASNQQAMSLLHAVFGQN